MREMVRELIANYEAYSMATLHLAGRDLIAAGIKPGPRSGELLRRALKATMQGRVPNRTDDCWRSRSVGWLRPSACIRRRARYR